MMKYKEFCKHTFKTTLSKLIRPEYKSNIRSIVYVLQQFKRVLKETIVDILIYISGIIYILFFPITSILMYIVHIKIDKINKEHDKLNKQKLKKMFNNE